MLLALLVLGLIAVVLAAPIVVRAWFAGASEAPPGPGRPPARPGSV